MEGLFSITDGVLSFDTSLFADLGPGASETLVFNYTIDDQQGMAKSLP